jgi:hypothetical protein
MRTRVLTIALASTAVTVLPAARVDASSATVRIVVRPVTAGGVPASGFHVTTDDRRADAVDCSDPNASPGAVSRNVEPCSPSAAYAIACWNAAAAHHVLCSRDPSSKRVYSIRRTGKFADTGLDSKRNRAPILLLLRDGTKCFVRDGGAWGQLTSHPNWYGTYSCDQHGNVWSPPYAPHHGVDESQPTWTVHTSPSSGNGRVTIRAVAQAYFVGTHA